MKRSNFVRMICLLLFCALFLPFVTVNASAQAYSEGLPDISHAKNVYFANLDSGKIIARKGANTKIPPASTVKIMTGMIAIEHFEGKLDTIITVTDDMLSTSSGTSMKLSAGDMLSAEDLIYGVICGGYNDAAHVLSYAIAGSNRDFVSIMNEKAKNSGAKNTVYTNPTGMDDKNMYTTLEDTVIIAKVARKNATYMEISSATSREIHFINEKESITIYNRNALVASYYAQGYLNKNANGMIAGMTDEGGYCLVTESLIREATYLCVVMGADAQEQQIYSYETANSLISYAKENLGFKEILGHGVSICDIPIDFALLNSSDEEESANVSVTAVTANAVKAFLPLNVDTSEISYRYYLYSERLTAPIEAGTRVGGIDFYYNGEIIATEALIIAEDIPANEVALKINDFKKSIISRKSIIFAISFILLSLFWFYFFDYKKRRKKAKKIKYRNY